MINHSPIIIGAVGGSGTRIVAEILRRLGYDMGQDLNKANDDMWVNLLFFRPYRICSRQFDDYKEVIPGLELIQLDRDNPTLMLTAKQLGFLGMALMDLRRTDNFGNHRLTFSFRRLKKYIIKPMPPSPSGNWGWKEPASHFIAEHCLRYFPSARYIHVIRHGLDMTFSNNINQVKRFGSYFDIKGTSAPDILRYWIAVNKRMTTIFQKYPDRSLLLRFEELCESTGDTIEKLAEFSCGKKINSVQRDELSSLIKAPSSIGRYKRENLNQFSREMLEDVELFGYNI